MKEPIHSKMEKKKTPDEKDEVIDIADVFEKFGRYQIIQYVLICLPAVFITMININYVFTAGDLNYRCRIPECEDTATFQVSWWPNSSISRCQKPVLKADHQPGAVCSNTSFSEELVECTDWVYESNNTVIAELNLACQPWHVNLIGTIHSTGMLISMVVSGWMSDRFGRKPTLIFCVVASCIGQVKTFATSYTMYVIVEFLEAAASGGTYAAAMVIMLEICGRRNRIMSGIVFAYSIYFGECLFACIAMLVPYWKNLIHIINGPSVFFISYIFLIHESPRWEILNGKIKQAKKTLLYMTDMNKTNINRQELVDIDEVKLKEKFNIEMVEKREGLKEAVTSKVIMKRLLVAATCRFTSSFVYYGMMINSVYLPGNKYTNFLLATVMSFPGELISLYLMNKIGRKMPLMVGYIVCGVLCMASGFVPEMYTWAKITLFLVGKMIISACFTGALTYTMELFPTSARGSLLGMGSFASRVGGMLAPITPILNPISEALPWILFGCSAVLAGSLLSLTPETKKLPLMDTIKQVEESDRKARELKKGKDNEAYDEQVTRV